MATNQVNFYSVTTSAQATANTLVNGIVFMSSTTGFGQVPRIYKNGQVFGADADSLISGLATGNSTTSYITAIEKDSTTGKVTAYAQAFPSFDYNPEASTTTGSSNNTIVSVTTQSGKVTGVQVATPTRFSVAEIGNGTETSTSNGVGVTVTTTNGVVTAVAVTASEIANVMHFRGTTPSLVAASTSAMRVGDIWLIASSTTSYYITPQGWGTTESSAGLNKQLVAGQEYILTSQNGFELIGDQAYHDHTKASVGIASDTFKGLYINAVLSATDEPTISFVDSGIATTSADITTTADVLVTAAAVAEYVDGKVTGGSSESTSQGINVFVSTAENTAFPTVSVVVTPATAITSTGTSLPTESVVYSYIWNEALVWKNENGDVIN